jgi:hypothetical protein
VLPTDTDVAPDSAPRQTRTTRQTTEFMALARERKKQADEADQKQCAREREDIAFYNGDQWPDEAKRARAAQPATGNVPATSARPMPVINKLREPIRNVLNDERDSDIGVQLVPADDFGDLGLTIDDTEIKLREGLIRRIQRDSSAADARTWAFSRAAIAGRGYYAVMTRFVEGKSMDKEIFVMRIYNQDAVWMDPAHEQPDGSDAEWEGFGTWMSWERYKATWPHSAKHPNRISAGTDGDFAAWTTEHPDWIRTEGDNKSVYVTDYYYVEYESRELCKLIDGSTQWWDELPEEITDDMIVDRRTCVERKVKWAKIDGINDAPLEETDWESPFLPIVKVLGEELHPHDNERRAEGMVRPARSSQEGFNYMIAKQIEMVGQTPISPLLVDPESIEGWEEWYKVAPSRPFYMLPARTWDDQGRQFREPHRPNADPNIVPVAQSTQMFEQAIQSTTAVPAAALGDIDPVTRSGKALSVLTKNSKLSTSNFMGNLSRSVRYEGLIENSLLYPIYGKSPNRLVRILIGNDSHLAMIADQSQPPSPQDAALAQRAKVVGKLTPDARFNVIVKVTKAYEERRDEERAMLAEVFTASPETFTWFADIFLKDGDGPGSEELSERAKVMLPPPIQAMLAAKAQGQAPPTPQEMQLHAQNAKLQQQVQELGMKVQTKQVEQEGKMQITQVQEAHEDQRAAMDREVKIAVAEIAAQAKQALQDMALFYEERARIGAQIHEHAIGSADGARAMALAHKTAQLEAGQSVIDHQHALTENVQQAALQPAPTEGTPA